MTRDQPRDHPADDLKLEGDGEERGDELTPEERQYASYQDEEDESTPPEQDEPATGEPVDSRRQKCGYQGAGDPRRLMDEEFCSVASDMPLS